MGERLLSYECISHIGEEAGMELMYCVFKWDSLKQSGIELTCKSLWQEHFLLPFVLSVCVLKQAVKDSQLRCLAFWESKQSCPPSLNTGTFLMCPACWKCDGQSLLGWDGVWWGRAPEGLTRNSKGEWASGLCAGDQRSTVHKWKRGDKEREWPEIH